MDKQDLIKGEYYVAYNTNIFIWGITDSTYYLGNTCTDFQKKGGNFYNAKRLATPEEKHWLDECIRLNKFITKEEAIKSFIPEYVKCILKHEEPAGKIYDTKDIIKQEPMREINIKLDSRAYSLDEISKVINANYEKEDALEIIKTIKSIK